MCELRPNAFNIDGAFEVSNYGHVRRRLPARLSWIGRLMSGRKLSSGYVVVKLRVPGKKNAVIKAVHMLVASAFLPPPNKGENRIHHKNDNKADNLATNLEWVTNKQNIDYAVAADRFFRDGKHVAAKLTRADVEELRRTADQFTRQEHAERFGVHASTIDDAISGRNHASMATHALGKPVSSPVRGESHPQSKLTALAVCEIVRRCTAGEHFKQVAADYPVSVHNVYKIMQGEIWSNVTGIQRKHIQAREDAWKAGVKACKKWCSLHQSLSNVKVEDEIDGFLLGWWIDRRRQDYKNGDLSKTRRTILEELDIVWSPHASKTELGLIAARKWASINGDLSDVPINAEIDGFRLGYWLGIQRTARNKLQRGGKKPNPRQAVRFEELTRIGINWQPRRGPKPASAKTK